MVDQNLTLSLISLDHFGSTKNLRATNKIHGQLLKAGLLLLSHDMQAKLVFTYTTCFHQNHLETLTKLLDCIYHPINPVPFNLTISQFCRNGLHSLALQTYSFMHSKAVPIDTYALCSSLTASSSIPTIAFGKQIHTHVVKLGWSSSVFVGSALIDLYVKTSFINGAEALFDEMPVRNTVCGNALLTGYAEAKMWVKGLELFRNMPGSNLDYDNFTLLAALRVCGGLSAIELGRQVHAYLIRACSGLENDAFLQSSLIEMYGKCGEVNKARRVFNMVGFGQGERRRDVVLWTSIISVYGKNGNYEQVIELYREMLKDGIRPDGVAFVTVISACSHTGQVNLGIEYFESMGRDFGLSLSPEHYGCIVDLFCRAGELDKAWKLVNEMSYKADANWSVSVWGALLSAYIDHGNVELGKMAAQKALELDPHNVGIYVLLSNMYASNGMWSEIGELRELMIKRGLRKDVGCSWVEVTT